MPSKYLDKCGHRNKAVVSENRKFPLEIVQIANYNDRLANEENLSLNHIRKLKCLLT